MSLSKFDLNLTDAEETEEERMSYSTSKKKIIEHFDLLLVGKTGSGKSHTGNTILGRPVFKTSSFMSSMTKNVEYEVCAYKHIVIKVVDTPGVADTVETVNPVKASQTIINQMTDAVILNPEGYHAFLLVVKFGARFTKEEKDCIGILKHIFGNDFVKNYCILIVTGGDQFYKQSNGNSFKKWRKDQEGDFKTLLEECNDRAVLFDNWSKDLNSRDRQLTKLFKCLRKLPNRGERYKDHHFQQADISRQRLIKETRDVYISSDLNELSLLLQKITLIPTFEEEKREKKINKLLVQTETLIGELRQDKEMGENKQIVIDLITDILSSIKQFQNEMNLLIKIQKEIDCKMDEEAEYIKDTMDKYINIRDSVKRVEEMTKNEIRKLNEQTDTLRKQCETEIQITQLENKEKRQAIKATINDKAKDFDNRIRDVLNNRQVIMILEAQKEACLKELSRELDSIDKLITSKRVEFDERIRQCKKEKRDLKAKLKTEKEKERNVKDLLALHFGGDQVKIRSIVCEETQLGTDKAALEQKLHKEVERNRLLYNEMKERSIKVVKENVKACPIL